jgi:hypothetical protein
MEHKKSVPERGYQHRLATHNLKEKLAASCIVDMKPFLARIAQANKERIQKKKIKL